MSCWDLLFFVNTAVCSFMTSILPCCRGCGVQIFRFMYLSVCLFVSVRLAMQPNRSNHSKDPSHSNISLRMSVERALSTAGLTGIELRWQLLNECKLGDLMSQTNHSPTLSQRMKHAHIFMYLYHASRYYTQIGRKVSFTNVYLLTFICSSYTHVQPVDPMKVSPWLSAVGGGVY